MRAADLARAHQAPELGEYLEDYADWIEAHLDEWTTTDDGVLLADVMVIADEVDSQLAQAMTSYISEAKTDAQPIEA